jgi:hypothetical protein
MEQRLFRSAPDSRADQAHGFIMLPQAQGMRTQQVGGIRMLRLAVKNLPVKHGCALMLTGLVEFDCPDELPASFVVRLQVTGSGGTHGP